MKLPILVPLIILLLICTVIVFKIFSGKIGNYEPWRLILSIVGCIIILLCAFIILKKKGGN